MALKLKGSTSGFVGLDAPSVAGNNTLILPNSAGSAGQILANDITAGVTTFTQVTISRNGDLTVPGTISIGGTLTYEDVTSVDSVGIVTARGLSIFGNTSGLSVTGVGTFAGDVSIADKIIHTGDTNTAIRFPAADTITAETAGSERVRIDSSGNMQVSAGQFTVGTTASTGLQFINDGTFGTIHSADLKFRTAATERARIDSSGRVLLGTTVAPSSANTLLRVHTPISSSSVNSIEISHNTNGADKVGAALGLAIGNGGESTNAADLYFQTATNGSLAERLRIDSSGHILIDHTADVGSGKLQVFTKTADALDILSFDNTAADGGRLTFYRNRNTTYGSNTKLAADDSLGRIDFRGMNTEGTDNYEIGASIRAEVDGTPGSGSDASDMPGRLMFFTTPDGTDSPSERLTINQAGNSQFTGIVTATEFVATSVQTGGRKNLLINGGMSIAQRGTAAVTVTTSAKYRCVDRFKSDIDGSGGDWSHAQSTDVPTGQGFRHSSKCTTVTQASQPTSESVHHQLYQMLEKQDVYHLEWGTSNAKTCTLSFWVKSSVTGTYALWFGFYGGTTYYYWTNYTINSANTWEKKTITVTGPTSGNNVTVDGVTSGVRVEWTLGVGSDSETGTLNEWTTSDTFRTASGTVYLPENAGATWYMTGAQFEVGSNASAYEFRSFGEELALCQRYLFKNIGEAGENGANYGKGFTSNEMFASIRFPVAMRATPTVTAYDNAGNAGAVHKLGNPNISYSSIDRLDVYGGMRFNSSGNWATGDTDMYSFTFQADAEL